MNRDRYQIHLASMDPQSRVSFLALFSCLLLFLSSLSAASSSASSGVLVSPKVVLALYYETLCPYCSNFIVNDLTKIFENGLISIIDLKLVPYGNAKIGSDNTISCQHGPYECLLNTVEACAIDAWPALSKHFPLIYCIENLVYERNYSEWRSCFETLGLESKSVADCYSSEYGKKLELQYAAETDALEPPHKYVPWVVVNGEPLYDDYEDFISYVCKAYNGTPVPEACTNTIQMVKAKPKNGVHYTEDKQVKMMAS